MRTATHLTAIVYLTASTLLSTSVASDWTSWRGNHSENLGDESSVPSEWDMEKDVLWKAPLPGPGNSSPIVVGDRVWLTQFDPSTKARQLRCYDAQTGTLAFTKIVEGSEPEPTHPSNPYCTASPVSNGSCVVAFFGSAGLCCFDMEGELKWQREFGTPQHLYGQGASPVIHGDLVTLNFGPGVEQFWVTLDLESGEEKWRLNIDKADAPNPFDQPDAPQLPPGTQLRDPFGTWATPLISDVGGRQLLILPSPQELRAVEPKSGKTVWKCSGLAPQVFASPIQANDTIVCLGGTALAVRPDGEGDVAKSHRVWFDEEDRNRIGTGLFIEGMIVANTMQGIVEAINPVDGTRLWQERLSGSARGGSWSSLVAAGNRVFATNKDGSVFVFSVKPTFELLGENHLQETTNATPALSDNRIFIRTDAHLWCVGS